ncbi:MAG: hypothetical protein J6C93_03340 [Clostridia bacterium]|nr:hypothetical protein [Clostridia bacterium]
MEQKKKIDGILEKTAEKLSGLVDVNTVIGQPITTASGTQVIPFSKITMGYLTGGGEYGDVKALKDEECYPFAGGAGTVVNIKPTGFLIDDGTGCRLVKISEEPLEGLMEKAGELIQNIANRTKKDE